jgi:hypothetical protein
LLSAFDISFLQERGNKKKGHNSEISTYFFIKKNFNTRLQKCSLMSIYKLHLYRSWF